MSTHPGRNEPCPCGSGKKYKHCCLLKDEAAERETATAEAAAATPPTPEAASHATAPPRATRPSKHATRQPWKRAENRGPTFNIPRRSGGS